MKKIKIPTTVRHACWDYYVGADVRKDKCFCCSTEYISCANFHCGHVISEYNGGTIHLSNLRPICGYCNSSMSRGNMEDFMNSYGFIKCTRWYAYDEFCLKQSKQNQPKFQKILASIKFEDRIVIDKKVVDKKVVDKKVVDKKVVDKKVVDKKVVDKKVDEPGADNMVACKINGNKFQCTK